MSDMRFIVNDHGKEQLVIEDAVIRFHNYSGLQTEFNNPGNRNFDVILPNNDMAVEMGEKGWNVKIRKPRDPEEEPYYTLNVKINMDSKWPPTIEEVCRNKHITYDKEMVGQFDPKHPDKYLDNNKGMDGIPMTDIGLVINGSEWDSKFGHGIKAYLDQFYFRTKPSIFGNKYDVEETAAPVEEDDIPF